MTGPLILVLTIFVVPLFVIYWIKRSTKGKMLCYFIRKDKSVMGALCELRNDFVIWRERAYDVYPEMVRLMRWPSGPMIPQFMQEIVPASLYLEEDAVPLDWVTLDKREVRAMELRAALDENFFRKMIHEATQEAQKGAINWRKVLPIVIIVVGIAGLIALLTLKGCPIAPPVK